MKNKEEVGTRKWERGSAEVEVGTRKWEGGSAEVEAKALRRMPGGWALFWGFGLLLTLLPVASGQQAKTPVPSVPTGPLTYDSFKLIHTRNVFDPDRRPVRPVTGGPATAAGGRSDYVALTGTLLDANKTYAFFSGSRTDFNRVLTVGDKIANCTVAEITSLNIVVDRDGKRTTVAVGQTVPLDAKSVPGAAPVNVADAVSDPSSGGSAPPSTANGTNSATPPAGGPAPVGPAASGGGKGPPANLDEIRRKMMEKRNQELK